MKFIITRCMTIPEVCCRRCRYLDPEYERTRTQIKYDPKYEDGSKKRELVEIVPHHFVQCSQDEIPMYQERAKEMD